ncbi:thioredoxin-like domain-containing protein [Bacteroidota bacterium]
MRIRLLFVGLLIGLASTGFAEGYKISISIPAFANDTVLIGHRFNANFIPKDTVILNSNGKGVFSGTKDLPHGMYLVYLPDQSFFDLLISNDQFFSFENDTSDYVANMRIKDSKENEAFYNYQVFLSESRNKAMSLQEGMANSRNPKDSIAMREELNELNSSVQNYIGEQIEENQDNFFGVFLLALQEVKVPDPPLDENGKPIDPAWQYKYYKSHYFDNFDISDIRLLRTPFYEQKVMTYIEKIAFQHPDSLILECDMLIEASRSDPALFRYMLITLFNHFAQSQIMGMDKVYIHIAEKYYIPEAEWSDAEFIAKLEERVKTAKPTLIGTTATDIQLVKVEAEHFINAADNEELKKNPYVGQFFNLFDIKTDYIILYFWESDCGHCKKATPVLYEAYGRLKEKSVEVIAVSTLGGEEGKVKWVNYINDNGFYDWINAWNPYDFTYKNIYDIPTTPQLFLLDKDRKIIAKKITPEQAENIIETLLKQESN